MDLAILKEERTLQWGNNNGTAKGWDNYRSSTFMEVIRAKWDRALQAQQQFLDAQMEIKCLERLYKYAQENNMEARHSIFKDIEAQQEKIKKLEFDGIDSMKDAFNYSRECLQQIEQFPHLYQQNRLR